MFLARSRETLLLLQEETLRLTNLVEDIMRLARADAARADLYRVEIEADRAIAQMLDAFWPQLDAWRITAKVDLKQRDIWLSADPEVPERLRQFYSASRGDRQSWPFPGGAAQVAGVGEKARTVSMY